MTTFIYRLFVAPIPVDFVPRGVAARKGVRILCRRGKAFHRIKENEIVDATAEEIEKSQRGGAPSPEH